LYLDSLILPTALNNEFYKNIEVLSPFGVGNPEPKFLIEDLKLVNSNIVANKHIKAIFYSKSNNVVKAIAFNSVGTILESYLVKNNKIIISHFLNEEDFSYLFFNSRDSYFN